jgi:hypothetical protein
LVEYAFSTYEALDLIPSTTLKKKRKKEKEKEKEKKIMPATYGSHL